MNIKNLTKTAIGLLCAALLLLVIGVALFLDSRSPDPILGIFQTEPAGTEASTTAPENQENDPGKDTEEGISPSEAPVAPPADLPSTIVIPTEKDPQTGEPEGIQFPCQIPEYGLTIQKMAAYNGMFVEDGTNANTENVAMLLVENSGEFPVEYTQICVQYAQEQLIFDISALPVGEKLVVQEKTGKPIPKSNATGATAMVVQRADMQMSEGQVRVTDNGNNTLTIENLTDKTIPTVRVFYKYYMEDEGIFVGGIAFTVRVTRLGAGASVTVQPAHYTSQTSRVVMVLTYDSEV